DQGQPVLGVRVQRRRDPARDRRPAQPDHRRSGDGVLEPVRRLEQPAAAPLHQLPRGSRFVSATETPVYGYSKDKDALIKRLHRIEGQVRGVEKMVEEDRYCIDILTQVSAATTALEALALKILDEHVRHCVAGALASGDEADAQTKAAELLEAVQRSARTR